MPRKSRQSKSQKPTIIVDDDEEYVVEQIVDEKKEGKKSFYLIKWRGFPAEENTWEPIENLDKCSDIVEEWQKNNHKNRQSSTKKRSAQKVDEIKESMKKLKIIVNNINESGCFSKGDKIDYIIEGRLNLAGKNGEQELLIKWECRKDKFQPLESWMKYQDVKNSNPNKLIEYYERYSQSQIIFKPYTHQK